MNEYYQVDEVIGRRRKKGKYEYLIKWKGYSINESTWEPLKNLNFIKNLIEEYDNSCDKKEDKKLNEETKITDKKNNIKKNIEKGNKEKPHPFYIIDNSIEKILGIKEENGVLVAYIEVRDENGKIRREKIDNDDLKLNNPWILIDYYESRATFI